MSAAQMFQSTPTRRRRGCKSCLRRRSPAWRLARRARRARASRSRTSPPRLVLRWEAFQEVSAQGFRVRGAASESHAPTFAKELPRPEDMALLLFSSGSTGVPKGIVYDHKWLMGGSYFVGADLNLTPQSRCLLRCSYVWSVSLYDLFPANMYGGTLVVPQRGGHMNVQYMAETIAREGIHALVIQPTLLNLLLDEHNNSAAYPLRSLRHVVSSGEKLFTPTAGAFVRASGLNATLWNMYGATEAGCTYFCVRSGQADKLSAWPEGVPAGVPQAFVDAFVMVGGDAPNQPLRPAPTGEMGEICFGGGGEGFMARGYWRREDLTAEKFVNTEAYGRLYRTGDVGRWQGGQLLVAGRLDRQVKIRGVRIQPEEIEARLKRYTRDGATPIKACLAVPTPREPIELVAFVETAAGEAIDLAAVRTFLLQELGRVYVPKHVVHLRSGLPRTASGKPDQPTLKKLAAEHEQRGISAGATASAEPPPSELDASSHLPVAVLGSAVTACGLSGTRRWEVDLTSKAWQFVQDHRYRGEGLFPGTGYVALAAEVAQATWVDSWDLRDLKFLKPLPLASARTLYIEATQSAAPQLAAREFIITISSMEAVTGRDGGETTLHCTCRVERLSRTDYQLPAQLDDDDATTAYPVGDLYAQLADGGFDYGHQFRLVQSAFRGTTLWQGSSSPLARGELQQREASAFVLDPVEMDACLHLAPLVSPLGFEGAPSAFLSVRRYAAAPVGCAKLRVLAVLCGTTGLVDFVAFGEDETCKKTPLFGLFGLQLGKFDAEAPELLRVVPRSYHAPPSAITAATPSAQSAPWVVAVGCEDCLGGPTARRNAEALARILGSGPVCTWAAGDQLEGRPALRSVVLMLPEGTSYLSALASVLPALQYDLPKSGRVWVVIVGDDTNSLRWLSAARQWAANLPGLQLSVMHARSGIVPACRAILDPHAPPYLETTSLEEISGEEITTFPPVEGSTSSFALERPLHDADEPADDAVGGAGRFAGLELRGAVAVLAFEVHPLALAVARALRRRGAEATLVLAAWCNSESTHMEASGALPPLASLAAARELKPQAVVLCAIGGEGDGEVLRSFEGLCAAAAQSVTICEVGALLPNAASLSSAASASTAAATASSRQRAARGHASWIVFAPPLMDGLWFLPPAPTGSHRCSVSVFLEALADAPAMDTLAGSAHLCEMLPKHWRHSPICAPLHAARRAKSSAELRAFLLAELSEALKVPADQIDNHRGIVELGMTSLATLRLSQRLRRFLGHDIPPFVLLSNPAVATLADMLGDANASEPADVSPPSRGRVLCLHGFKTSSAVLKQQMAPIGPLLEHLGYEVVVPDGAHKTSGPAQFAAGLDEDDSFGWWTYEGDGHDSQPLGLQKSLDLVHKLGSFEGVLGFSQGGAMAAQVHTLTHHLLSSSYHTIGSNASHEGESSDRLCHPSRPLTQRVAHPSSHAPYTGGGRCRCALGAPLLTSLCGRTARALLVPHAARF